MKFFDPDACMFETHGFFEELFEPDTGRVLGIRKITEPDRPLGSEGRKEYEITQDTEVKKGYRKLVTLRASAKRPLRVVGMIQVICGRLKPHIDAKRDIVPFTVQNARNKKELQHD